MCTHLRQFGLSMLASLLCAMQVLAQEPMDLRQETRARDLEDPLEEGVADVSALGMSLRQLEPGLVMPMDFGDVYRVPGMPDMLMRIAGGMYAVFPQSVYSESGAMIPPGTTFHIGAPPSFTPGGMLLPVLLPVAVDARPLEVHTPEPAAARFAEELASGWSQSHHTTIANNSAYRRDRVRELLLQAAGRDSDPPGEEVPESQPIN